MARGLPLRFRRQLVPHSQPHIIDLQYTGAEFLHVFNGKLNFVSTEKRGYKGLYRNFCFLRHARDHALDRRFHNQYDLVPARRWILQQKKSKIVPYPFLIPLPWVALLRRALQPFTVKIVRAQATKKYLHNKTLHPAHSTGDHAHCATDRSQI